MKMRHRFVEFIPDELEDGILYISITYATVLHKCCCGCGNEVVTPLSPSDWQLTFDGETISLFPSIGNWSFPCRSHYWIRKDKVVWVDDWYNRVPVPHRKWNTYTRTGPHESKERWNFLNIFKKRRDQ